MIPLQELRIGNKVITPFGEKKVISLTPFENNDGEYGVWVPDGYCRIPCSKLKPIEITEGHLVDLGFEIIRYVEPKQSTGTDLFHGYDYAVKKIGVKTYLVIRFQDGKFKLEGFYSKTFTGLHEIQNLISILS